MISRVTGGTGLLGSHLSLERGMSPIDAIRTATINAADLLFFAETQVGWVPYYGEDADENYKRHKYWSGLDMPHLPSWYLRRHFSWGFQIDHYGVKNRHEIAIDKLQWSTDFPHVQCDWPNSRQVIEEQFAGVPEDEKRQIVCDNALRYFRLDRE